jgi:hypothetical protein
MLVPKRFGPHSTEPTIHNLVLPLHRAELWVGLCAAGGMALLWLALMGRRSTAPIGPLLAGGVLVGMWAEVIRPPTGLIVGLAVLALGGAVAERPPARPLAAVGASIPGALILAFGAGLPSAAWIRLAVLITVTLGGALIDDFDRHWKGMTPLLLAIASAGAYYTVPDTEHALVLLGATVGVLVLGGPFSSAAHRAYGPLICGVYAWVVVVEASTRSSSALAALACLGVLIVEPASRLIGRCDVFSRLRATPLQALVIAFVQLLLVVALHALGHRLAPTATAASIVGLLGGLTLVAVIIARAMPRT